MTYKPRNATPVHPRMKEIQDLLAKAHEALAEAKKISDEIGQGFDFMDRTYVPKKTIVVGGDWDSDWNGSNC